VVGRASGETWSRVEIGARARARSGTVGGDDVVRARLHEAVADLAVWLKRSGPPIALISESGGRREDRRRRSSKAGETRSPPASTQRCSTTVRMIQSRIGSAGWPRRSSSPDQRSAWSSRHARRRSARSPRPPTTTCRRRAVRTPTCRPPPRSRSNPFEHPPLPCGFRQCKPRGRRSLTPRHLRRPRSGSVAIARSSAFPSLGRAGDGAGLANPYGGGGRADAADAGSC